MNFPSLLLDAMASAAAASSSEGDPKATRTHDGTELIKSSLARANWKLPDAYRDAMKRAEVMFVATGHHAYSAVEGKGLQQMIQAALDAQYK
jgi:hypothetical protein